MERLLTINAGGRRFTTYLSTLMRYPETKFAQMFNKQSENTSTRNERNISSTTTHETGAIAEELFIDVNPEVFEYVLHFMRTNRLQLPTSNELVRTEVIQYLNKWGLLPYAISAEQNSLPSNEQDIAEELSNDESLVDTQTSKSNSNHRLIELSKESNLNNVLGGKRQESEREYHLFEGEEQSVDELTILPNVCVVQLSDHLHHDQGMKRHAMTISFGTDGFHLRRLCQRIRKDLNMQLSSTYWQCYQTGERALFFTTTKVANGAADLMTTSILQQIISHTENFGYELKSSYITLSPDVMHTSVRLLIHNFIFRRVKSEQIELDELHGASIESTTMSHVLKNMERLCNLPESFRTGKEQLNTESHDNQRKSSNRFARTSQDEEIETYQNFEPRPVGPQMQQWTESPTLPNHHSKSKDF